MAPEDPAACEPVAAHPLRGRYAVRTVAYARHKATYGGAPIDTVSKGVLLSIAEVSESGIVTEQLCAVEVLPRETLYGWLGPVALSSVEPSRAQLVLRDGSFVRSAEQDQTFIAWRPYATKEPCTETADDHACTCSSTPIPTSAEDCRVSDADVDGAPGLTLSADVQRRADPEPASALFTAHVVGVKAIEWKLPGASDDVLHGQVSGRLALWPLNVGGQLGDQIRDLRTAACPAELGRVQLVHTELGCDELVAARAAELDTLGIFEVTDPAMPSPASCSDPDCAIDSDGDGTVDCKEECDLDPEKRGAGQCGCGESDVDSDADGTADCHDACPTDAARATEGFCGCNDEACSALLGRYATRTTVYLSLQTSPQEVRTWRVSSYAHVSIARGPDGKLTMEEQPCWTVSEPNPENGEPAVYGWTLPTATAVPVVRSLTRTEDGRWIASSATHSVGFESADCTSASNPPSAWPPAWGASCTCEREESGLPPYDRDSTLYDCRLTDPDHDGDPGLSIVVSTSPPPTPNHAPPLSESARLMLAGRSSDRWTIEPSVERRHTARVSTVYAANVVGCTGAGCSWLPADIPPFAACNTDADTIEFVPADSEGSTCTELLNARDSLFPEASTRAWPSAATCRAASE